MISLFSLTLILYYIENPPNFIEQILFKNLPNCLPREEKYFAVPWDCKVKLFCADF